ncbi:Hypothetical protein NocV09_00700670 [Nannochloropsis oceanica]
MAGSPATGDAAVVHYRTKKQAASSSRSPSRDGMQTRSSAKATKREENHAHTLIDEENELNRPTSPVAISGLYLFILEFLTIGLVLSKALHTNAGKKFVRVAREGCDLAWADMEGDHSTIACCSHTPSLPSSPSLGNDERWDAALCAAATSAGTKRLTSSLAALLPFLTWGLNCLFFAATSWWRRRRRGGREGWEEEEKAGRVWMGQYRRLGLYAFVIMFRTGVLLMCLNRVQAWVQAEESDACWYSGLRHDGRCRERFDFADHGVLFLSQYLAIQTFEVLAVLREATSLPHLLLCITTACLISLISLVGFYDTVSFFHTRLESVVGVVLSFLTVQLPLMLIASGRLSHHRYLRISHYIKV